MIVLHLNMKFTSHPHSSVVNFSIHLGLYLDHPFILTSDDCHNVFLFLVYLNNIHRKLDEIA